MGRYEEGVSKDRRRNTCDGEARNALCGKCQIIQTRLRRYFLICLSFVPASRHKYTISEAISQVLSPATVDAPFLVLPSHTSNTSRVLYARDFHFLLGLYLGWNRAVPIACRFLSCVVTEPLLVLSTWPSPWPSLTQAIHHGVIRS